jgi:hypothetical protein
MQWHNELGDFESNFGTILGTYRGANMTADPLGKVVDWWCLLDRLAC